MEPMQTPPDPSWPKFAAELMWVILAMAGGIARYLDIYLRTGVLPKFGFLFAHAVVSGFSGYMVAQVMIRVSPDWALVAAGIGGYLGTQGLDWISQVLKDRVARSIPSTGQTSSAIKKSSDEKVGGNSDDL
jgi:hypothetical protein